MKPTAYSRHRQVIAGVGTLAMLAVAACEGTTRSEPLVSTLTASISGAVTDEYDATTQPDTVSPPSRVHTYAMNLPTPGYVAVFGIRAGNPTRDFLSFLIPNVRATRAISGQGTLYLVNESPGYFELDVTVRVARLTSTRLSGTFTALGIDQETPATPDTVHVTDGRFDILLDEPVPEPAPPAP